MIVVGNWMGEPIYRISKNNEYHYVNEYFNYKFLPNGNVWLLDFDGGGKEIIIEGEFREEIADILIIDFDTYLLVREIVSITIVPEYH